MTPLAAPKALEQYFFDARARLLDLAAILDRINRGADASSATADPRIVRIREALDVLRDPSGGRAERIQKIFSLDYDPNWKRPAPK